MHHYFCTSLSADYNSYFWVGAWDGDVEEEWRWVKTGAVASILWAENEPNGGTGENCLAIHAQISEAYDVDCGIVRDFICEM